MTPFSEIVEPVGWSGFSRLADLVQLNVQVPLSGKGCPMKLLKWAIALMIFTVVLCGLFNAECRQLVFANSIGGFCVGIGHGMLHIACILDQNKRITLRRVWKVMRQETRTAMVIGLLIGVSNAVAGIL
jgi:hypothetical protein